MKLEIEPLDEPQLQGRTVVYEGDGSHLLPELLGHAETTAVGEERIVVLHFPVDYEIPHYRGVSKHFRLGRLE